MIDKPGVYNDVSESAYHADPCPEPSLSSGIIKTLNTRSPRHAWQAHPRLNPGYAEIHKTAYDIGHAAHALRLHDDRGIVIIDAKSYQTNDAKAQRDQAYIDGKVPVLADKMAQLVEMYVAGDHQLAKRSQGPLRALHGVASDASGVSTCASGSSSAADSAGASGAGCAASVTSCVSGSELTGC